MAKRKKTPKRSQTAKIIPAARGFGRKNFDAELRKAEASMNREDWHKAYQTLTRLGEDYPERQIIWEYLAGVCLEMENLSQFQFACEQWIQLDPNNGELHYNLGRTYLSRSHPLLALQTLRRGLELDPSHAQADEIQGIVTKLEAAAPDLLAEIDLPKSQAWEIAILHERGQAYLEEGQIEQARATELAVLDQYPHFCSAQNNLSLIAYMDGNLEDALHWSQTVLDQDPSNIHALSNLIRFHVTAGKIDQAQTYVEPLLASQADAWDGWTKKVEALSYLADDAGVIKLYEQAKESDDQPPTGLFYHLVAVAYAQTGDIKLAKQLWKRALELNPLTLRALLKPCMTREKFHYEEYAMLADAQIAIAMAKKDHNQVRSWLNIWEQVDPEHPKLFAWQERVKQQVFFN